LALDDRPIVSKLEEFSQGISRREFARRVGLATAGASVAATVSSVAVLARPDVRTSIAPIVENSPQGPPLPKLTPEGQAEATRRTQAILDEYGSRFTDAQKADLQRLSIMAQPPLDRLRAYPVQNGDGTALYLKPLIEREKKTVTIPPVPGSPKAVDTRKKP
jgi:hypothetical protein